MAVGMAVLTEGRGGGGSLPHKILLLGGKPLSALSSPTPL